MISIIICSRTQDISKDLFENIKNTVGCEHELVVIDNSENAYSIFEAYNLGIKQSRGDFLYFIHDDIIFHSNNWGNVIQAIFNDDKQIGLIGVAGAKIKTKTPSAWWDCPENEKVINIIQHFNNREIERQNIGFNKSSTQEVVTIDGVFIAMRKDKRILFNYEMKGFHNYDLNISIEYQKYKYKIIVTNEILIEHFSIGNINESWVDSTYDIHKRFTSILPLGLKKNSIDKKLEQINTIRFINKCFTFKQNKIAIFVWKDFFLMQPISKYHYTFWKRIIKEKL